MYHIFLLLQYVYDKNRTKKVTQNRTIFADKRPENRAEGEGLFFAGKGEKFDYVPYHFSILKWLYCFPILFKLFQTFQVIMYNGYWKYAHWLCVAKNIE